MSYQLQMLTQSGSKKKLKFVGNIGINLYHRGLGNAFLSMTPKVQATKENNG